MEEILASIRRILNEDDPTAAAAAEDVLVLDSSMRVTPPEEPVEPSSAQPEATAPAEPFKAEAPAPEVATEANRPVAPQRLPDEGYGADAVPPVELPHAPTEPGPRPSTAELVAPEAAAAAASALGSLVRTLTADRKPQVWSGGPTLEDLVRAELRPLLKAWLDANLPPIVERTVRAEIERVVGRAIP